MLYIFFGVFAFLLAKDRAAMVQDILVLASGILAACEKKF